MLPRRSILKLFGAAPLAVSSAARAGAESLALGSARVADYLPHIGPDMPPTTSTDEEKLFAHLARSGVPSFVRETLERRKRYDYVQALDADLASLRSFSLSTKIRLQRERNVERHLEKIMDDQKTGAAQRVFQKLFGVRFYL